MSVDHVHGLREGARLNQYEIVSILGSGGFGITYLARDLSLDALVAIKEYLPGDLATRQEGSHVTAKSTTALGDFKWGLDRFLAEARVLAKFRHQNIVHIFQVFEANNTAYIVMEYAEGKSLAEYLQQNAPLSEQRTKEILFPIMDGLKRVHEQGFLHRDIKPGNIILRDDGGPVLIDFGAARQAIETKSRSITSIITEGYAPLEQYDPNGNQGAWTDVHALGAVAYKCLTGNTPPAATSRVRNDPLAPLNVSAKGRVSKEFAAAIEWALAVYEDARPQTVQEFTRAITGETSVRTGQYQAEATRVMRQPAETTRYLGRTGMGSGPKTGLRESLSHLSSNVSRRSMMTIGGVFLILIVVAAAWLWLIPHVAPEDEKFWQAAARDDSIASYAAYRREEPAGYYAEQAQRRITDLRNDIDVAWADAQKKRTIVAIQGYIGKYQKDGLYISEATALITQIKSDDDARMTQAKQQELAAQQVNMSIERNLVDAGAYGGPVTGASAEVEAALVAFQKSNGLAMTGQPDPATMTAVKQVITKNRLTKQAYASAIAEHTRAGYSTFLTAYGTSSYAKDINSRMSQCHTESIAHTTSQTSVIQGSGKSSEYTESTGQQKARDGALNTAKASCTSQSGTAGDVQYVNESCPEDQGAALLGGLACGLLSGGKARCTVYKCVSTASLQCVKSVTSSTPQETCP